MNLSIKEKIYGCLAGAAVGDALGLGTEFMTRSEAQRRYPGGLRDYKTIIRDAHRGQWKRGDWTNDTEMVLLLADSMAACGGIDHLDFARRLKEWHRDTPADVCPPLQWVLTQPDYLEDPEGVAKRTWEKMARFEASNEALGRALTIALWPSERETAIENAVHNCLATHHDSRCSGTAGIIAAVAHALMWEERMLGFEELKSIGSEFNPHIVPYIRSAWEGDIEDLELDDPDTLWYTRKSAASALWALWHCSSAEEVLFSLVDAAGDADTNAGLGLALAGLKWGYEALPKHLVEGLVQKQRLLDSAEQLTAAVEAAV